MLHSKKLFNNLKLIAISIIALFIVAACSDDEPQKGGAGASWIQEIYPLAGTKWQVSKVIHTKTGIEKPIFVGDDICTNFVPILEFETDTSGIIHFDTNLWRLPFNLSNNEWWQMYYAIMPPSNIAIFIDFSKGKESLLGYYCGGDIFYNIYFGHIGYKLEGELLKFYQHDDGFFTWHPDGRQKRMFCCPIEDEYGNPVYPYSYDIADTNWYNCVIWEEIK